MSLGNIRALQLDLARQIETVETVCRLLDLAGQGLLDLSDIEIFVLDEADRMLDMGFIPDIKRIVAQLPRKGERQTMLFSATLDDNILRLASGWLADPVVQESEPEQMVSDNIEQTFYSVLREEKLGLLLHILRTKLSIRIFRQFIQKHRCNHIMRTQTIQILFLKRNLLQLHFLKAKLIDKTL